MAKDMISVALMAIWRVYEVSRIRSIRRTSGNFREMNPIPPPLPIFPDGYLRDATTGPRRPLCPYARQRNRPGVIAHLLNVTGEEPYERLVGMSIFARWHRCSQSGSRSREMGEFVEKHSQRP